MEKIINEKISILSDVKANNRIKSVLTFIAKNKNGKNHFSSELYLDSATYQVFEVVPQKDATVEYKLY